MRRPRPHHRRPLQGQGATNRALQAARWHEHRPKDAGGQAGHRRGHQDAHGRWADPKGPRGPYTLAGRWWAVTSGPFGKEARSPFKVEEVDDLALHIACGRAPALWSFLRGIGGPQRKVDGVECPALCCNDWLQKPWLMARAVIVDEKTHV